VRRSTKTRFAAWGVEHGREASGLRGGWCQAGFSGVVMAEVSARPCWSAAGCGDLAKAYALTVPAMPVFGDLRLWNGVARLRQATAREAWRRGPVERLSGYPVHVTEGEFKEKTSAAIQN